MNPPTATTSDDSLPSTNTSTLTQWPLQLQSHLRQWASEDITDESSYCENIYHLLLLQFDHCIVDFALEYCQGNVTRASRMLGISTGSLRKKAHETGLDLSAYRALKKPHGNHARDH